MSNEINWNEALKPAPSEQVSLAETTLDEAHEVTFVSLTQTPQGYIVANVESETLEGDTLWLRGKFGSQNGFGSLLNAVENEGEMIEGNSFIFTKVTSIKSPKGYAYRWQKVN